MGVDHVVGIPWLGAHLVSEELDLPVAFRQGRRCRQASRTRRDLPLERPGQRNSNSPQLTRWRPRHITLSLRLVLGCINADVCNQRAMPKVVSRSTRHPHVCTARNSFAPLETLTVSKMSIKIVAFQYFSNCVFTLFNFVNCKKKCMLCSKCCETVCHFERCKNVKIL